MHPVENDDLTRDMLRIAAALAILLAVGALLLALTSGL